MTSRRTPGGRATGPGTTSRRRVLGASAGLAGTALAGCLSDLADGDGPSAPPTVSDRPAAVYYPTHVEGMDVIGTVPAGPYRVGLFYSYPHRFWLVTGRQRETVEIQDADSVHLMAAVWDPETSAVLPVGDVTIEAAKGGESLFQRSMWPMLSQNMGLHFGDNVALDGDGTYELTVDVAPVGARRTGAFEGRFGERASATAEFEFSHAELNEIAYRRLDDRAGQRGAVDAMEMEMLPLARTPAPEDVPGTVLGEGTSGDATVVVVGLDAPAGVDGETGGSGGNGGSGDGNGGSGDGSDGSGDGGSDGSGDGGSGGNGDGGGGGGSDGSGGSSRSDGGEGYLAVSPRTPYHGYPLPFTSASAILDRAGETAFEGPLLPTFDPDLGYHYGATVGVAAGDELTVSFGAPPQLARHEGYETAFFEMEDVSLTV